MLRIRRLALGSVLLPLLLGAVVARAGDPPPSPAPAPRTAPASARWPRYRPMATVLLVGRQGGRLKPCGCTKPQTGGLERMAAVLDLLRERAEGALAALSVGGVMAGPGTSIVAQRQAELKAALYRRVIADLGFGAAVLGPDDLFVKPLVDALEDGQAAEVERPRLPANLMPSRYLGVDPEAPPRPWADLRLRSLALRVLSVVDEVSGEGLKSAGLADYVMAPASALQGLAPNPDVLWIVAVSAGGATLETVRQAMLSLGPAVIVDLSGTASDAPRTKVSLAREPLVVSFADRGRSVGVLDLDTDPASKGLLVSYVEQPLAPEFESTESPSRTLVSGLFDVYRAKVREGGLLALLDRRAQAPEEARFVGSAACAACHPGISQSWTRTPHARALRTLREHDYAHDPECLTCHVLGPRREAGSRWSWAGSGFVDPEETPHLGGVGCESCHGPGSLHVAQPWEKALFARGGPNRREPGREGCMACHDLENSAAFADEYSARLERVDHRDVPSDRRTTHPR